MPVGDAKNKADKARWQREWRKKNPEKARAAWRNWESEKEYDRNISHRKRTFKLDDEKYKEILVYQNGVCPICKEPPNSKDPFVPDHDHSCCPGRKSCGKCIRGLLHRTCNAAIGLLKDCPTITQNATNYLVKNYASEKQSSDRLYNEQSGEIRREEEGS